MKYWTISEGTYMCYKKIKFFNINKITTMIIININTYANRIKLAVAGLQTQGQTRFFIIKQKHNLDFRFYSQYNNNNF